MLKQSAFLFALLFACKTDDSSTSQTSAPAAPAAEQGTGKARSGKIDLPPRAPSLPGASEDPAPRGERAERWAERRKERMARLDTDGDGEVSDEEREAARDMRQKGMLERFDKDKDGTLSEAELAAARHERTEAMRARFDTNGDGKVSPEELSSSRFGRFRDVEVDADHDGNITTEELEKAMGDRMARRRGERGSGATEAPAPPPTAPK